MNADPILGEALHGASHIHRVPPQTVELGDNQHVAGLKAINQLGKPYIYGGVGPQGYDCSGLTMQAYLAAGVQLPRTSEEQALVGTPVASAADLKPGDLLFAAGSDGTAQAPGHVAIYAGDGYVIEAPHTGLSIMVDSYATAWAPQVTAIRRIIN